MQSSHRWLKYVSFLLVFVLMLQITVPMAQAAPIFVNDGSDRRSIVAPKTGRTEIPEWRKANSRQFINADGTFTAEVFNEPVFFRTKQGNWSEIDSTLIPDPQGGGHINAANSFRVRIADEVPLALSAGVASISLDGASIALRPLGVARALAVRAEKYTKGFTGLFGDADLVYDSTATGLKESIVLNKPTAKDTYRFALTTTGLTYAQLDDGSILFSDINTGSQVFVMPAPYMLQNGDERVYRNVTQRIVRGTDNAAVIEVSIDPAWLADPTRQFPVIVDPTIDLVQGKSNVQDAYVLSNDPNTTQLTTTLLVGSNSTNKKGHSYLWFDLPALPASVRILDSSLSLTLYDLAGTFTGTTNVDVYRVNAPWSIASGDANRLRWGTGADLSSTASGVSTGIYKTPGVYSFAVKDIVAGWYAGTTPNYGVSLRANPDLDTTQIRTFRSSRYSDSATWPKLTINYDARPTGTQPYWGFTQDSVNVKNGNLALTAVDLTVDSRGIPVTVSRTYNSLAYAALGLFGAGWRSSLDMRIDGNPDGPVVLTTATGTKVTYVQPRSTVTPSAGVRGYKAPPGIFDTLTYDTTTQVYTLTTQDRVKYLFSSAGNLTEIDDPNSNATKLTWVAGKLTTLTDASSRNWTVEYSGNYISAITDPSGRKAAYAYTGDNLMSVTTTEGTASSVVRYSYPDALRTLPFTVTDPEGRTTSYMYDQYYRVASVTRTVGGQPATAGYVYVNDGVTGGVALTVTDAASRIIKYSSSALGNPTEVAIDPSTKDYRTVYVWDNYNQLIKITDAVQMEKPNEADRKYTALQYNGLGQLRQVTDPLGQTTNYTYNGSSLLSFKDPRGNMAGSGYDANRNKTESYDALGDAVLNNFAANGNLMGNTTRLGLADNLLPNPSFEEVSGSLPRYWTDARLNSGDTAALDTSAKVFGRQSLKVVSATANGLTEVRSIRIPVVAGQEYNLSASVMAGTAGSAVLNVYWYKNSTDVDPVGTDLDKSQTTNTNGAWVRRATGLKAPALATYVSIAVAVRNQGTAWFDAIQLDQGAWVASNNLVTNEGFELDVDSNAVPDSWGASWTKTPPAGDGSYFGTAHSGVASLQIKGSATTAKSFGQYLGVSGTAGTELRFAGYGKSSGATAGRSFGLQVKFDNTDGSTQTVDLAFAQNTAGWDYKEASAVAVKDFKQVTLNAVYENQTGTAWFDDITVAKLSTVSAVATGYNPVESSSFETAWDGGNQPTGWTQHGAAATFGWTGIPYTHTGRKAVSLSPTASGDAYYESVRGFFPTESAYTFFGFVRTQGLTGSAKIVLRAYDTSYAVIKEWETSTTAATGTTDWRSVFLTATQIPANTYYLTIAAKVTSTAAGGTAWFDDLRVVPGKAEVGYGYDASGNYLTSVSDQLGNSVQFQADARGNLTAYTDANASQLEPADRYQTTFTYDMNDQMTGASYPYQASQGGAITASAFTFVRDKNGALTSIIDPYGTSRRFTYNDYDQIKTSVTVSGGVEYTTTYTYDLAGNLTQIDAPDAVHHTTIAYDTAGRPTQVAFVEGSTETQAVNFTYDANGNPLTANTGALTYTMLYDELNRMTSVSESADVSITYTYDSSVLKTRSYKANPTDQWSTDYTYDSAGRIKSIRDSRVGRDAFYLYNEAGQITKQWLATPGIGAGGIAQFVNCDAAGRLTELRNEDPNGVTLQHYRYQYDANGNLTRIDEPQTGNWSTYVYDVQNQLVQEQYGQGGTTTTVAYTYDEVGNRTSVTRNGVVTTYSYDAEHNRLTAIGGVGLTYNAAGNVTGDGSAVYTWDDANRLSGYQKGATSVSFTYDGLGRRREKTANGSTLVYHWDGDKLAYTDNAGAITRFTYDPQGRPLMMGVDNQLYYYQLNAHGDAVGLTDINGTLVATYSYDAWGRVEASWENAAIAGRSPFRYAGYIYDTESELYYLMARYYNPVWGRFISRDTVGYDHSAYSYCANAPSRYVDTTGNFLWLIPALMVVVPAAIDYCVIMAPVIQTEVQALSLSLMAYMQSNPKVGAAILSLAGNVTRAVVNAATGHPAPLSETVVSVTVGAGASYATAGVIKTPVVGAVVGSAIETWGTNRIVDYANGLPTLPPPSYVVPFDPLQGQPGHEVN